MKEIAAIILAAGKSKRMKTRIPKVMHRLMGKPVIEYVVESVEALGIKKIFVVVGFEMDLVKEHLKDRVVFVEQREQLGTGHAVQQVIPHLKGFRGDILVLCGDMPLASATVLDDFADSHRKSKSPLSLLTSEVPRESDFGRIVRDRKGNIESIVEFKDATAKQKKIKEVNLSIYLFGSAHLFDVITRIGLPNVQKEIYLTDTVYLTVKDGLPVNGHICSDPNASRGINSRRDLTEIYEVMRQRTIESLMESGVTFIDPGSCHVDASVKIGMDSVIYPCTIIEKGTVIGEDCQIGPFTRIIDASVGRGVRIQNSVVLSSSIDDETEVGPFAYIRPENVIGRKVKIGDFVELKKSRIGNNSKVPHLSYIGDTTIGERVNIGAGTITANYDGRKKNPTVIGDGTHIGSNSVLVAPVKVGKNSKTGAGAVVIRDVPDNSLVAGVPALLKKKLEGEIVTPHKS